MADILLQKPTLGQSITLTPQAEDRLVFEFDSTQASLERDGDNLIISFDDGSSINLAEFYVAYTSENMPTFLIEETEVLGEAFFAALGEDLMPAAGITEALLGGGNTVDIINTSLHEGLNALDGLDQDGDNSTENTNPNTRNFGTGDNTGNTGGTDGNTGGSGGTGGTDGNSGNIGGTGGTGSSGGTDGNTGGTDGTGGTGGSDGNTGGSGGTGGTGGTDDNSGNIGGTGGTGGSDGNTGGSGGTGDSTGGGDINDVPEALTDQMSIIAKADYNGNDFSKHFDEGNDAAGGRYLLVDATGREISPTSTNDDGTLTYELWGVNNGKDVNWGSVTFDPATGKYEVEADGGWVSSSQMTFNVAFEDGDGDRSSSIQVDVSEVGGVNFYETHLEDGANPNADRTVQTWSPPKGYTIDVEKFETGTFTGAHGEKYTVEVVNGKLQFTLHSVADNPAAGGVGSDGANHWKSSTGIDIPLLDANGDAHDLTISMGVVDSAPVLTDMVNTIANPTSYVKYEASLEQDDDGVVELSQLYNFGGDGIGAFSFMNVHTTHVPDANGNVQYDFSWGTILLNKSTGDMVFELNEGQTEPPVVEVYATDSEGDVGSHIYVTLNGGGVDLDTVDMSTLLKESSTDFFETQMGDAAASGVEDELASQAQAVLEAEPEDIAAKATALENTAAEAEKSTSPENDDLYGDSSEDLLSGLGGNDALYGGAGNDVLLGGSGNDVLDGGLGADVILGGTGSDVIILDMNDTFVNAGEDADGLDIDILLGQGAFNINDVMDTMDTSSAEMAIYGDVRSNGQDAESVMAELGITKEANGNVTMGSDWGQGQISGDYTAFTQHEGTEEQITVIVETIKLTSGV